jgi:hypothetical protein
MDEKEVVTLVGAVSAVTATAVAAYLWVFPPTTPTIATTPSPTVAAVYAMVLWGCVLVFLVERRRSK